VKEVQFDPKASLICSSLDAQKLFKHRQDGASSHFEEFTSNLGWDLKLIRLKGGASGFLSEFPPSPKGR
jgi:hypothetical protein